MSSFICPMPGVVLIGSRYNQETAPDVAIDRAEIISTTETVKTPAGTFVNSLLEKDTDGLDPGESANRYYAPGSVLVLQYCHPYTPTFRPRM